MNVAVFFLLLFLAAAIGWSAHAIFAFFFHGMGAGELRARLEQMNRSIDSIDSKVSGK